MNALNRILAAAVAALIGTGLLTGRNLISRQQQELDSLQHRRDLLVHQDAQLQAERDGVLRATEVARQTLDPSASDAPVTVTDTGDPATDAAVKTWLESVHELKRQLEENPAQKIPELQLLKENDWLDFARRASHFRNPDETDRRNQTFGQLRNLAKVKFGELASNALGEFLRKNEDRLPTDPRLLAPYFTAPIDPAILARYAVLHDGKAAEPPGKTPVMAEISVVDDAHDEPLRIFKGGFALRPSGEEIATAIATATLAFTTAHAGQTPAEPDELTPFLDKDDNVDAAAVRTFWNSPARHPAP